MEKFQWIAVFEMVVALFLAGIIIAFLAGPLHRMAWRMHGLHPHGYPHSGGGEPGSNGDGE